MTTFSAITKFSFLLLLSFSVAACSGRKPKAIENTEKKNPAVESPDRRSPGYYDTPRDDDRGQGQTAPPTTLAPAPSDPPSGGGGTNPPSGGGGGATPAPGGGGSTTPPSGGGGSTTPPSGGGGTTPAPAPGGTTPGGSSNLDITPQFGDDNAIQGWDGLSHKAPAGWKIIEL